MCLKKHCNVMFDGGLHQNLRSSLVCEFLKYVLYQRNQIPLPFEHVQRDMKLLSETECKGNSLQQQHQGKPIGKKQRFNKVEYRKAKEAVHCIEKVFDLIHSAFETCPDVRQILVILGGTTVSPKERYLLNLPDYYPDLPSVSSKAAIKALFRELITSDLLGGIKPLLATNTMVLVNAPRDSLLKSFLAKPRYKPPDRGQLFELDWGCVNSAQSNMDLSLTDDEVEISGILPLDSSLLNLSVSNIDTTSCLMDTDLSHSGKPDMSAANSDLSDSNGESTLCVTLNTKPEHHFPQKDNCPPTAECIGHRCVGQAPHVPEDEGIHSLSDEDYIWFQAPMVIKGYKDRTSRVLN